jgi:hypothetical protein
VARLLAAIQGVVVTPDPPHTNLFHAFFPVDGERLIEASLLLARADGVALFTRTGPCDVPGHCAVEISIGDAADGIDDAELDRLVRALLAASGAR